MSSPISLAPSNSPLSTERRMFATAMLGAGLAGALAYAPAVFAAGLDAISNRDVLGALRGALEKGAGTAVSSLGRPGGFFNDPKRRIPLPGALDKTEKLLRMAGKGDELDALHQAMNKAAEQAVPKAKPMLMKAIKSMQVQDARKILSGGEHSVTDYFKGKTEADLSAAFKPIVAQQIKGLGIAKQYDALAGRGAKFGLVKDDASSLDGYVTGKAIDALYAMIAEQERAIRSNPVKAGSALLGKVFGALK